MGCHKLTYHENFPELKVEQGKNFACEKTGVRVLYFGARYYNSDISVWLSVDPFAFKYPSQSPYSYVGNRPINTIDRWGLDEIKDPNGNEGEAGDGYKQTADKKYLYGDGLKTKKWDPDYEGGGSRADGTQKGGYVDYEGKDIDFELYNERCNESMPTINGQTGPFSSSYIDNHRQAINSLINWIDGTNQATGYTVSLIAAAMETESVLLNRFSTGTFIVGTAISAAKTDFSDKESRIEFEIGTGVNYVAYRVPWAIPFAMSWSVIMLDKEYSKTLPERAAKGYKMSHDQFKNHPYFRNLK